MKKGLPLFLLLIFAAITCLAQTFEGKITYANKYTSKLPNITDAQFSSMMGIVQEFYIKGGNYRTSTNGTLFQWQVYSLKDNRLYSKMSHAESVLYNDASENKDEVIKAEVNKGALQILGYTCDELVLTCKSGTQKYYYNSAVSADVKAFENFKFGNWYEVISRTGSIPLKTIIENGQFILENTATDIKPMKVDEKMFELPAGAKIEKSPF